MAIVYYAGGSPYFDEMKGKYKPGTPQEILNRVPKNLWPSQRDTIRANIQPPAQAKAAQNQGATLPSPVSAVPYRIYTDVQGRPAVQRGLQRQTQIGYPGQDKLEDVYRRYGQLSGLVPQAYEAGKVKLNLPERTFTSGELHTYVGQAAQQAGRSVPVPEARFQTPEQLSQTIQQITQVLEPYTKVQEESAKYGFGQALQNLAAQWAARGLLASGAAAAQERMAAENLARQLAEIRAQQQAQAIPLALQYGQLGLQEAGQRFNQQMANLQYQQQALADAIRNYLSGMSQEEAQRQFAQNYALQRAQYESQRAQQQLENLRNILGAQTDVAGRLAQLGLSAGGLTGVYGGAPTLQALQSFAPWIMGMTPTEQAQLALQAGQLTGTYGGAPTLEAQRLANELALQTAQLTGQLGGVPTLEARRMAIEKALQEAGLTGQLGGVPTLEARRMAIEKALQEAGLTGVYEGKETIPAMQAREEIAQRWAQIRGTMPTGEPTIDRIRIETDYQLAKAQQDWNRIYQGGLLDLEKLRILSNNAYREGQLKLGTLDTTLRYLETLGYPKDIQQGVTQIVNYAQSGGAGMSLRNYVTSKNGTVEYDDSTRKVTINLPGTPPISFVAGNNAQMAALGLSFDPATEQHYVSDPAKFNAFTGNFYGLSSPASSSKKKSWKRKSSSGGSSSFSLPSSGPGSESWARKQVSKVTGKSGSIESQLSGMSQSEKLATLKKAGLI